MRQHLTVSHQASIKVGNRLQVRAPQGISYESVARSIDFPNFLNQDGMPLVNDGDEWPTASECLGKIAADSPYPEGEQVIVNQADHIRW